MIRLYVYIIALLFSVSTAQAADTSRDGQDLQIGKLNAVVWGADASAARKPVIIFSHGFHGCATQSLFLMNALAKAGYIVFAMNHHDATCHGGASKESDPPQEPIDQPEKWNERTFHDRAEDIAALIAGIKSDPRFRNQVDWDHFGLAGHSLGGYTIMALSGAWPGWKINGPRAILALSPYSEPFVLQHTVKNIAIPVMYQGGTQDWLTPPTEKPMGAYDQTAAPKYFVEFNGADHLAWADVNDKFHDSIARYSVAFFNKYVRGMPGADLTAKPGDVKLLRFDEGKLAVKPH